MKTTNCYCEKSGFCPSHNIHKNDGWFQLCQTREKYFEAWEQGIGPGQNKNEPFHHAKKVKVEKVGDILHSTLKTFGIKPKEGCSCNSYRLQMNTWGVEGCIKNKDKIVEWLHKEATKRSLPFSKFLANQLVNYCINKASKS